MQKYIDSMKNYTDCTPWYWLSYGDKCYAFAVVQAFPANEGDDIPKPGAQLEPHPDDPQLWVGENGTDMLIDEYIANIERQNGDTICSFIAAAHAALMGDSLMAA